MKETKFKAMVLSCMDPRFQQLVQNHLKKKLNLDAEGISKSILNKIKNVIWKLSSFWEKNYF